MSNVGVRICLSVCTVVKNALSGEQFSVEGYNVCVVAKNTLSGEHCVWCRQTFKNAVSGEAYI